MLRITENEPVAHCPMLSCLHEHLGTRINAHHRSAALTEVKQPSPRAARDVNHSPRFKPAQQMPYGPALHGKQRILPRIVDGGPEAMSLNGGRQPSKALEAGLAHRHKLLRPPQFNRSVVETQRIPPAAQGGEHRAAPARQLYVLNGRPAGIHDQFEVVDRRLSPVEARQRSGRAGS